MEQVTALVKVVAENEFAKFLDGVLCTDLHQVAPEPSLNFDDRLVHSLERLLVPLLNRQDSLNYLAFAGSNSILLH